MTPEITGIIGIVLMVMLMLTGMPIAFSMALTGFVGFSYLVSSNAALFLLGNTFYFQFTSYTMLVVPLFVLMGQIAYHSGLSKKIFDTTITWVGFIPGGLAIAAIGACAGFSAICGSSTATAATMGTVALPEMEKANYDPAFASGTIAAGGTLGILIPPSIVLIIYGIQTELSIGKLFVAGIGPGILLSLLFVICILIMCRINPALGSSMPKTTFMQKIRSLAGVVEMFILFGLVMGGIVFGWFTPTEAAGIGAAGSIIIALIKRNLPWEKFKLALFETTRTSAMVLLIIACAMIFSRFLSMSGIPQLLATWVAGLDTSRYVILACIMLIYVVGGCFMDALSFLIITINIFFPIITKIGFDPIWFGVIIVILLETGAISPPVGINVYVIKGIASDIELTTIFKGIIPFLLMMIIGIVILTIAPDIALFLPNLLS